jgi:hypothetical protein
MRAKSRHKRLFMADYVHTAQQLAERSRLHPLQQRIMEQEIRAALNLMTEGITVPGFARIPVRSKALVEPESAFAMLEAEVGDDVWHSVHIDIPAAMELLHRLPRLKISTPPTSSARHTTIPASGRMNGPCCRWIPDGNVETSRAIIAVPVPLTICDDSTVIKNARTQESRNGAISTEHDFPVENHCRHAAVRGGFGQTQYPKTTKPINAVGIKNFAANPNKKPSSGYQIHGQNFPAIRSK